jgi:hypothetical protein
VSDVPLWLSIVLYAVAALAIAGVLYLLMVTAMRVVLREPLAELRTARRRQEDLLRDLATSASYLAAGAAGGAAAAAERRGVPAETDPAGTEPTEPGEQVDAAEPVVDQNPFARPVDLPGDGTDDSDEPDQASRVP